MKELDVVVRLLVDMPDDAEAMDFASDFLVTVNAAVSKLEGNPQFGLNHPWEYSVSDLNV